MFSEYTILNILREINYRVLIVGFTKFTVGYHVANLSVVKQVHYLSGYSILNVYVGWLGENYVSVGAEP
jgi:hypothetical protein